MESHQSVIYVQGIGDEPPEQKNWQVPGFNTEHMQIDWAGTDYEASLQNIGERILEIGRVSLVGVSGGGKAVLSLFARYPDITHRVVTISSKVDPYIISSDTREAYPNLVTSSDTLPEDLKKINDEMRQRILCVHPLTDEVVSPTDAAVEGAHVITVQADGHIQGIAEALTGSSQAIADFIKQD